MIPIACLASVTFANATWPELAIWASPPGANGDATDATVGSASTCSSIASIRLRAAGSVTLPCSTAKTICSRSPDAFGATFCSRCSASKLCVPERLKLSL